MKFSFILVVFLCFVFSQAQVNSAPSAANIIDAIASFQAKLKPLLNDASEVINNLNNIDTAAKLQEIIATLENIKQEGLTLLDTVNKNFLMKYLNVGIQISLKGIDSITQKIKDLLNEVSLAAQDEQQRINDIALQSTRPALKNSWGSTLKSGSGSSLINTLDNIASQTQAIAKTCFQAFLANVPSSFCWKKGLDFGVIPVACPDGYVRDLAVCRKPCEAGYNYHPAILSCWGTCTESETDYGAFCKSTPFSLRPKGTYFPDTLTNFNSKVLCPEGMYKSGALCYRDCTLKQMVNCGIGACALTNKGCYEGVLKITVDFMVGLGKFVTFIASHTQNDKNLTTVVASVTALLKKVDEKFIQKAFDQVKEWIGNNQYKQLFVELMVNFTNNYISEKYAQFLNNSMIVDICTKVHGEISNQMQSQTKPTIMFGGVDMSDVQGTIDECSKVDLSNDNQTDEMMCIKKALKTAAGADATGLTSMAAAFMNPVCNV